MNLLPFVICLLAGTTVCVRSEEEDYDEDVEYTPTTEFTTTEFATTSEFTTTTESVTNTKITTTTTDEPMELDDVDDQPQNNVEKSIPINVTTLIRISNFVNRTNYIENPVNIQRENINNFTADLPYLNFNQAPGQRSRVINKRYPNKNKHEPSTGNTKCCNIVHPEKCEKVESEGKLICVRRRHTECSPFCTSKNFVITAAMVASCVEVPVYPYKYCPNYTIRGCDSCFPCEEKSDCFEASNCPEACISSFQSNKYNTIYFREPTRSEANYNDIEEIKTYNGAIILRKHQNSTTAYYISNKSKNVYELKDGSIFLQIENAFTKVYFVEKNSQNKVALDELP